MDIGENKFIIFHQGGSGGDFLCSAINYLYYKNDNPIIYSSKNTVETCDDEENGFKNYTKELIKNNSLEYKGKVNFCLGSHHYSPLLKNIFINSKMYWIDFTGHDKEVYNRFTTLLGDSANKIHKKVDAKFLNCVQWKLQFISLKMDSIKIDALFSFQNFKTVLNKNFSLELDKKIEDEYYIWFEKNRHFFNL